MDSSPEGHHSRADDSQAAVQPLTRSVTLDLEKGETLPLLVNSLDSYARVLDGQSAEQHELGADEYARNLTRAAREARTLVEIIIRASQIDPTNVAPAGAVTPAER